jgi:glycosyltransferase involved in cell wall biosynthesis
MIVLFVNENTLGHASYLPPFVEQLQTRPELGIQPRLIDATPLPPELERRAAFSVKGLRRWGLDFHVSRWRLTVSRHVKDLLLARQKEERIEAAVVNTQSVALALIDMAGGMPLDICLDATFTQLARSAWFAPNPPSRWFLPLTLAPIRNRERLLFRGARRLWAWSEQARQSLLDDYHVPSEKIGLLPPSIELPPQRQGTKLKNRPQILFVGGDFRRKGGPLVLECFRRHLASRCDLHLVTHSQVPPESGVFVHRGLVPKSPEWRQRWEEADVFVFPSTLETFGIVLLEALAFEAPAVSSKAGAARYILDNGKCGVLLESLDEASLAEGIRSVLSDTASTRERVACGRERIASHFDLATNAARLAESLRLKGV